MPLAEKAPAAVVKSDEPGSSPPAPASPTTAALADAHRTGQHPEQTSPLLAPPPFDAEVFAKNPAPYLTQSVPGRVFQTATPGPGVPVLASQGRATVEMPHGESRDLAVKAPPGSPVTFTTFDLGTFANGLPSITVVAGPDGVATARYAAVGGVVGDVHILAGSPQASGQVKFHVSVEAPISKAAP